MLLTRVEGDVSPPHVSGFSGFCVWWHGGEKKKEVVMMMIDVVCEKLFFIVSLFLVGRN